MRTGVLSDVHANLPALQAVLGVLARRGVDQLLVAGDLIGYGGQPDECVATLAEAGAHCVLGNHDLLVLDRLPPTRFPAVARMAAKLHRSLLSAGTRSHLESLPTVLRTGRVLMAHGSLDSPEEYVTREPRALELLARLPREAPGADTLVLGHTHQPWLVGAGTGTVRVRSTVPTPTAPWLLNPGSVGQSRQRERRPRARCAVIDDVAGTVEFLRVDFDVAASREELRRHGLPDRCLHAPPPVWWPAARRARLVLDRAAARLPGQRRRRSARTR
ncbi:metallophosphoesterase [Geodermatophilus sp. DSM 45219]|uniref:metallophosphoesterase family protein n=1 Tax=Geodermatophilus sp. DSM 45219 TaxID=1881103 RepID=UPI00088D6867|nr:metallophosphoesterase family protein [Geodermatophilus sp. DSM 45219]SDN54843.1 Predicted phosphodiesterase [Geodermatophilus sp. DSM 45219]